MSKLCVGIKATVGCHSIILQQKTIAATYAATD